MTEDTTADSDTPAEDPSEEGDFDLFAPVDGQISRSSAQPLKNWSYVGRCYDILTLDPLALGDSARPNMAFEFPREEFVDTPDKSRSYPEGTRYTPAGGGKTTRSETGTSTAYDFKKRFEGSIEVSAGDPTGELFSASLSASFKKTRNVLSNHEKIYTYVDETIPTYKLEVSLDLVAVAPDLDKAFRQLPVDAPEDGAWREFFERFGTHFSVSATLGGRAFQSLVISKSSYNRLVADEMDVGAEAKATFEIAKVGGKATGGTSVSQEFSNAVESSVDSISYEGGNPQEMFDMWAMNVPESPAPITLKVKPLYELLVSGRYPSDPEIDARRTALKTATETYLRDRGHDVSSDVLRFGDRVDLVFAADGRPGYLIADASGRTTLSSDAPDSDAAGAWTLVNPDDPASTATVGSGSKVALRNVSAKQLLDAAAGQDDEYASGDGLVAAVGTDTTALSAQWKLERGEKNVSRPELVSDDYFRLRSQWENPDGDRGYLMTAPGSDRRVFSFGGARERKDSLWMLRKLSQ